MAVKENKGLVTFIRIPKNASTSLYSFFGDKNTIRNDLLSADNNIYLNIFEPSHCSIQDGVKLLGVGLLDHPLLAITRNPFDRFVSMYFFAKKYNIASLYGININDFDSFAEGFKKHSKNKTFFHAKSQSEFIHYDDEINLTVARFENLDNDINEFIDNNSLNGYFEKDNLPKLNTTDHNQYKEYYSPKSKAIIADMWGSDLDKFEYSFN